MFRTISLMPHSVCWKADPQLVWTMVVTNAITFVSYVSICGTLFALSRRTRRVIAGDWAYFVVGFALFIVACGSTHLLEVITTWTPIFWVDAWTNIVTAVLSAWVAINLLKRLGTIAYGINDYAERLGNTEREKREVEDNLLAAHRLEEWSRMSAVLAHEINNPLEAIQNLLYMIRTSDEVPQEIVHFAEAASDEAKRVMEISRSTLTFFRQTSSTEMVDLRMVAESVRFLVAPLLERQKIRLEVVCHGDVAVLAYPVEVRQALLNLVRNACEATDRPGTKVLVQLTGRPEGVEMVIRDEGSGIDSALLSTLFQFGSSTKGEKGNGMGLWTVRHIMQRHGGTVDVESTRGVGTRFVLFWPRESTEIAKESSGSLRLRTTTA
jgi:signal transduction histidine kinase